MDYSFDELHKIIFRALTGFPYDYKVHFDSFAERHTTLIADDVADYMRSVQLLPDTE